MWHDSAAEVAAPMPALPSRLILVTDAWSPQVNGVVTTLKTTVATLQTMGVQVQVIEPGLFTNLPCPTYPEIRLAWRPAKVLDALIRDFAPNAIHIATEGPLGFAARRWCLAHKLPFTTAYHTQFPEYLAQRFPIPATVSYALLKRFHSSAVRTMVATQAMQQHLQARGFAHLARWSRGVDTQLFQPGDKRFLNWPRPIMAYAGRVAVEKNIEAFLKLELPGTKLVIGNGPALAELKLKYPRVQFVGYQFGSALVQHLAAADVFVFPSLTDTFGLVMLEAMACGLPVAAFPVTGPIDVVRHGIDGCLHPNLDMAIKHALQLDPARCRERALQFSWQAATQQFINNLAPFAMPAAQRLALQ